MSLYRLALTTWLAAMLWSCQTQQSSDNYSIEGRAEGFTDGDTLYIAERNGKDLPFEMAVVENGRFSISGLTESSQVCMVYSPRLNQVQIPFFIEPGQIQLYVSTDGASHVSGTENNEKLQALNDSLQLLDESVTSVMDDLYGTPTRSGHESMARQAQEEAERLNEYLVHTVERNIGNELGYYILADNGSALHPEQRLALIHQLPAHMQQRPEMAEIEKSLSEAPQEEQERPEQLTDAILALPAGGTTTLTEEATKHRVTVVQFWASWSTPYFRELPEIKRLYHRYSDMGLGLVGVSLDNDDKAWCSSIDKNGLSWLQVSDLKGWDSELIDAYRVDALPYYIVADSTGKILATGNTVEEVLQATRESLQ